MGKFTTFDTLVKLFSASLAIESNVYCRLHCIHNSDKLLDAHSNNLLLDVYSCLCIHYMSFEWYMYSVVFVGPKRW